MPTGNTVYLSPILNAVTILLANGAVAIGANVYTFLASTTTPANTYTTNTGITLASNPITATAAGLMPNEIWIPAEQPTKFVVQDANGNLLGTYDNILGVNDPGASGGLMATYSGYLSQNSTGVVTFSIPQTLAEAAASVVPTNKQYYPGDLRRYGAVGNNTAADTAFIAAVAQAAIPTGAPVIVLDGVYLLNSNHVVAFPTVIYSDGSGQLAVNTGITINYSGISNFPAANMWLGGGTVVGNVSYGSQANQNTNFLYAGNTVGGIGPNGLFSITPPPGDSSTNVATTAFVRTGGGAIQGVAKNLLITTSNNTQNASNSLSNTMNVVVTASEITVESITGQYLTIRNVSLAINANASGLNGVDVPANGTSNVASNTWYNVYAIYNPTTNTVGGILSANSVAPANANIASFPYYARLGAIKTMTAAPCYPLSTMQMGRVAQYVLDSANNLIALPMIANTMAGDPTIPTWVGLPIGKYVPPTAATIKLVVNQPKVFDGLIIAAPNPNYGQDQSLSNPPPVDFGLGSSGLFSTTVEWVIESSNIYYASAASGPGIYCLGWTDNL